MFLPPPMSMAGKPIIELYQFQVAKMMKDIRLVWNSIRQNLVDKRKVEELVELIQFQIGMQSIGCQ